MKKDEWIKKLKPYWHEYRKIEGEFHVKVSELEERMRKECKNKNLEFAYPKFGGGLELYFGIGFERDYTYRKPGLIQGEDMET